MASIAKFISHIFFFWLMATIIGLCTISWSKHYTLMAYWKLKRISPEFKKKIWKLKSIKIECLFLIISTSYSKRTIKNRISKFFRKKHQYHHEDASVRVCVCVFYSLSLKLCGIFHSNFHLKILSFFRWTCVMCFINYLLAQNTVCLFRLILTVWTNK